MDRKPGWYRAHASNGWFVVHYRDYKFEVNGSKVLERTFDYIEDSPIEFPKEVPKPKLENGYYCVKFAHRADWEVALHLNDWWTLLGTGQGGCTPIAVGPRIEVPKDE